MRITQTVVQGVNIIEVAYYRASNLTAHYGFHNKIYFIRDQYTTGVWKIKYKNQIRISNNL